jgi:hypothetical protein
MNEDLLQFIWQHQYFNKWELKTVEEKELQILDPGVWNRNQGPDFLGARIMVEGVLWIGNVELHVRESDWDLHGHNTDPNYANVILHVVWKADGMRQRRTTLELEPLVPVVLLERYREWMLQSRFIPCATEFARVPVHLVQNHVRALMDDRMRRKADVMLQQAMELGWDWEELCWLSMARAFGYKVNADAFESMARTVPYKLLLKIRHDVTQVEALIFGQAGLLRADIADDHARLLWREYGYLRKKHRLAKCYAPVHFLRMRPGNFPTIRLAQLATLVSGKPNLFPHITRLTTLGEVRELLTVRAPGYWEQHYRFGVLSPFHPKQTGEQFIDRVISNMIIPLLLAYGIHNGDRDLERRVLEWPAQMPAEDNPVISGFLRLGVAVQNIGETQGLLQLHHAYCSRFRCLECAIGKYLMKKR